jgi:hypothetical protein
MENISCGSVKSWTKSYSREKRNSCWDKSCVCRCKLQHLKSTSQGSACLLGETWSVRYGTVSLSHNLFCTHNYHVKNKHRNLPGEVNLSLHYYVSCLLKCLFVEQFIDGITVYNSLSVNSFNYMNKFAT